ncbi:MAG: hypothetical protein OEZ51_04585 [Nitrospinota bacterium]|nr:hypothetical protein [Nitrospinota bacterium]
MPPGKATLWGAIFLLGWLSGPALAQEQGIDPAGQEDMEMPSLELLEFLGNWETDDGEWIDPEEMEQIALGDEEKTNGDATHK